MLACSTAERHDLIAKLFKDTASNAAGCYNLRLFLDGQWQPILIDDRLPCTKDARRPEHVFDTGLAFSRAANSQLWVCLLEKAYAKAHGSYKAISGGHIAEALLDLTGAPTFTINFDEDHFNLDKLWCARNSPVRTLLCCALLMRCAGGGRTQLVYFKSQGFPMGCATGGGDAMLKEVGLCGSHAYSILECREVTSATAPTGTVRLLRIRNPHGCVFASLLTLFLFFTLFFFPLLLTLCLCFPTYTHVHAYTQTCIHACMHAYTNTHTHTHTHICWAGSCCIALTVTNNIRSLALSRMRKCGRVELGLE